MKRLRVKSFSNSPSEVWTGLKLRYVLILARRCYSAKNSSFDSPTSVPPGPKWANSWGAKRLIWQVLPHMVFSQIKEKMAVSWACACRLSSTLFSPAWVQLLYSAVRKYSSGTGLCSILCDSFTFLASYAFLLQIIPAFYKSRKGGPEAQQELDKQLTEFEKELGDKKFVGGEMPLISKQMMQVWNFFVMDEYTRTGAWGFHFSKTLVTRLARFLDTPKIAWKGLPWE